MVIHIQYIEYLLSTPKNYTCPRLAAYLPEASHNQANQFLCKITLLIR